MSIELNFVIDGECRCGVPYFPDDPPPEHAHRIECDWGEIEHPQPRPDRGEVGHLMLAIGWWVGSLLSSGTRLATTGGTFSSTSDGDRVFTHLEHDGRRWTWEMFPVHFADGHAHKGDALLVGRWPD